jgi:hypothetical protein
LALKGPEKPSVCPPFSDIIKGDVLAHRRCSGRLTLLLCPSDQREPLFFPTLSRNQGPYSERENSLHRQYCNLPLTPLLSSVLLAEALVLLLHEFSLGSTLNSSLMVLWLSICLPVHPRPSGGDCVTLLWTSHLRAKLGVWFCLRSPTHFY